MAGYMAAAANGWEALCCVLFFRSFADMRSRKSRWQILAAIGFQAFSCIFIERSLQGQFHIRIMAESMAVSLAMLYLFRTRYLAALVLSMFFLGLDAIMECLSMAASERFHPFLHEHPALLSGLLLFAGVLLTGKIMKGKAFHTLTRKEWSILFVSTFITLITFAGIASEVRFYDGSFPYLALPVLVVDYVVYCLIDEIMVREIKRKEDEAFRERVKYETEMYRSVSENLERQRKRTHEFKNQMAVIHALATKGQYGELLAYVEKADTALQSGLDAIDTNHVIVNAVLNAKYREAVGKGIVFVLKVNDLSALRLCDEDIVLILSNLLNNAMEACERAEEKVIKLKFVLEREQIVISVQNSMASMPVMEDGTFLTTKISDAQEHGIGIRNVADTVEKYGGKYAVDFGGDGFRFSVLLDNPVYSDYPDCPEPEPCRFQICNSISKSAWHINGRAE